MNSTLPKTNNEVLLRESCTTESDSPKQKFADYIKEMRSFDIGPNGKKGITTRELAKRLDINYEQFRKILNMNKPTKKRDCIIAICAALRMDIEETNEALNLYNYMPVLNSDNRRDDILMTILEEQYNNPLTIEEINRYLIRNDCPELDIIDHRVSRKRASQKKFTPYKLLKKQVRTFSAAPLFGDPYDSLAYKYSIFRYNCFAKMWLRDEKQETLYKLTAAPQHQYFLETHNKNLLDTQAYKTIDDTGVFKEYFIELEGMANQELKKLYQILNDTKNYQTRIGAGICDETLHIYVETYNYKVPEINEYYLYEYKNGMTVLSVFHKSEFMRCYLRPDTYSAVYGKNENSPIARYSSIEELLTRENENASVSEDLLRCRSAYFRELKKQADNLLLDLKAKKKYIRHLEDIYDDLDRVCEYFGVEKEFNCTCDDEYGAIMSAEKRAVDFQFEDCGLINISIEDLYNAFELGFSNIHEICRAKKKWGSIENMLK